MNLRIRLAFKVNLIYLLAIRGMVILPSIGNPYNGIIGYNGCIYIYTHPYLG